MYQCFTKVCRLILIFCFTSEFLLGLFLIQFYSHQESNILHRLIICCIKLNQKLFFLICIQLTMQKHCIFTLFYELIYSINKK